MSDRLEKLQEENGHLRRKIKNLRKEVKGLTKCMGDLRQEASYGTSQALRHRHDKLLNKYIEQLSEINRLNAIINAMVKKGKHNG